ncbi:TPA: DegT/DnrJ/EryC1/StrS family aminotransferase [Candidatus Poribacteria bacterium]|nr:DegT/DnrJ/EryC1/StrS family aminotransferase [Candidatus Poribacteria bacterium]
MAKLAINGGTPVRTKPFPGWPLKDEAVLQALKEVWESGVWGIGGDKVPEFEREFARYVGAQYGVAVTSGTVALQLAVRAAGIGAGDEVIVPPYTFIATASSVIAANAIPVFADIDPDTFNIDPSSIEAAITERTKGVIPVHIGGCPADMDAINEIARKHGLTVIEDCAQAHGAEWKGERVGSIGDMGCFSFQSSKNLPAGEGGMITTNDKKLEEKVWSIHNCGRRKEGAWYEHNLMGGNYRMTEWQAAVLLAQLPKLDEQTEIRNRNSLYLAEKLSQIEGIKPQKRDERVTRHGCHLFIFKFDSELFNLPRERFIAALRAEGIPCSSGYNPLYRERMFQSDIRRCPLGCPYYGKEMDYSKIYLPVVEKVCRDVIWIFQSLLLGSKEDMDDIIGAVEKVVDNIDELK